MACVLIVGANRGIGLELCRQMAGRGDRVIATCRRSSPDLEALRGIEVHTGVDVTAPDSVDSLAEELGDHSLDLLVIVAGVLKRVDLEGFDADVVREQFEVNALGALATTVGLLRCLKDGSKIGLLTSRMGSLADNTSGGSYGYRMSKAALNMAGRSLAHDLRPRGIAVAILHPGWVQTDMTNGQGLIDAATSAAGLIERLDELTLATSGTFVHESGELLPW
jgi:NAD(P)-dependent dehydrogenase (short-subunit alcohol dehydrogenase family)